MKFHIGGTEQLATYGKKASNILRKINLYHGQNKQINQMDKYIHIKEWD